MNFRIRSLLAIVAVVAVIMAAALEIWNHSQRDELFSKVMTYHMVVAWHSREAMLCRAQSSPYSRTQRMNENRNYYPGALPGAVTSWKAEASFHEVWARRFGEKAENGLRELDAFDAKLLFH